MFLLATVALLGGCAPRAMYYPTPCKQDYDVRRAEGVPSNVAYELYIDCLVAVAERQTENGND